MKKQTIIEIILLTIRSAILAAACLPANNIPSEVGQARNDAYWNDVSLHATWAVIICLILYGIEASLMRVLHKKPISNSPLLTATYRGTLLIFILALTIHKDAYGFYRALGNAFVGSFVAAALSIFEQGLIKLIKKCSSNNDGMITVNSREELFESLNED